MTVPATTPFVIARFVSLFYKQRPARKKKKTEEARARQRKLRTPFFPLSVVQLITFFFTENFLSHVRFSIFAREKRKETFRTRRCRRYRWARCENKTRFLLSYRATRTHTNLEKGKILFFFFFCLLSSDKLVNFTETLYTGLLFSFVCKSSTLFSADL
jgi:hypothetical protein